ncbi:MAG: recombination mediator RecR [Mycoplasmatota bacterium]
MSYPKSIINLIECYKKLPGVGEKTAERLAIATMDFDDNLINLYLESIKDVKTKIVRCEKCNHLSESNICSICGDNTRDNRIICVVEEPKNVIMFEKLGSYRGLYHVLDGLISPMDGVNPDDLKINLLLERIEKENIEELILALKPSIEGETTSLYIQKISEKQNIKISKIAHGIPIGADMEYVDPLTLEMALEQRKNLKE